MAVRDPRRPASARRLRPAPLTLALLLAAIAGAAVLALREPHPGGVELIPAAPPPGVDEIRVDVAGAVREPGVVRALPGERVADVIARAGGFAADADREALNLARRVGDEERVEVPRVGAATGAPLLDVNRATARELEALPGIGPVYAARVIEARAAQPFRSTDELVERGLWPQRTYAAVRDRITARVPGDDPP